MAEPTLTRAAAVLCCALMAFSVLDANRRHPGESEAAGEIVAQQEARVASQEIAAH